MAKKSRDKGARGEREFAKLIGGLRVPLSGAQEGYPGDVAGLGMLWECKMRADGFRELYKWLEGADALAVRADRREWLAVIPVSKLLALIKEAEAGLEAQGERAP